MLSKFKSAKHQQHLAQLPKLAQSADDVETLFHTRDFKGRLLAEIAGAKKTVYISALYIEHDDAGRDFLDALYAAFPREQVLLLRNEQLRDDPEATVDAVCRFLGVGNSPHEAGYGTVFSGQYERWPARSWRWRLLRWWWRRQLAEQARHGLYWQ